MFSSNTTRRNTSSTPPPVHSQPQTQSTSRTTTTTRTTEPHDCMCEHCVAERRNNTTPSTGLPQSPSPSRYFDISFNIYMEPQDESSPSPHVLVVHPRIFDIIDSFQSQFDLYQNNLRRAIYNLNDIMTDYAYNYADYQYYIINIIQHLLQMNVQSSASTSSGIPSYTPSQSSSYSSTLLDLIMRGLQTSLNREMPSTVQMDNATGGDSNETAETHNTTNSIYSSIMNMLTSQIRERFQNRASTPSAREHLTNAQIYTATRIIKYSNTFNEQRCPISLDEFVIDENICQIKHCSHIFKNNSLMVWLRSHRHCPVCRYDLSTYVEPVTTTPTTTTTTTPTTSTTPTTTTSSAPITAPIPVPMPILNIDIECEPEPSWLYEDVHIDSIPFFNTISPPLPSPNADRTSSSSRIVDNIYNLVSSGLNTLSANQTNNPITQMNDLLQQYNIPNILQSTIREHSNNSNHVVSIDERFPEQPDVD
jgi:hypothetical protein